MDHPTRPTVAGDALVDHPASAYCYATALLPLLPLVNGFRSFLDGGVSVWALPRGVCASLLNPTYRHQAPLQPQLA